MGLTRQSVLQAPSICLCSASAGILLPTSLPSHIGAGDLMLVPKAPVTTTLPSEPAVQPQLTISMLLPSSLDAELFGSLGVHLPSSVFKQF